MKVNKVVLICLVSIAGVLSLVSCNKGEYFEVEDGHAFVSLELAKDIQTFENEFPLSDLSAGVFPIKFKMPVIRGKIFVRMELGDKTYTFRVNPSYPYSYIYAPPSDIMAVFTDDEGPYCSVPVEIAGEMRDLKLYGVDNTIYIESIDNAVDIGIDGLLGKPFFDLFDNAVFDYANDVLLLNQDPVSETEIPIFYDSVWDPLHGRPMIQLDIGPVSENGIIWTDTSYVILREKWGLGDNDRSSEEILAYGKDGSFVVTAENTDVVLNDVSVGGVTLQNIPARYWNDRNVPINNAFRKEMRYFSFFGTDMWADHVIQLDFKNQVFRIK